MCRTPIYIIDHVNFWPPPRGGGARKKSELNVEKTVGWTVGWKQWCKAKESDLCLDLKFYCVNMIALILRMNRSFNFAILAQWHLTYNIFLVMCVISVCNFDQFIYKIWQSFIKPLSILFRLNLNFNWLYRITLLTLLLVVTILLTIKACKAFWQEKTSITKKVKFPTDWIWGLLETC